MKPIAILISAEAEWRAVRHLLPSTDYLQSPFGEYFEHMHDDKRFVYFHGGWGKIAAAASAQYCIDTFQPDVLVNLGTCGGFTGHVTKNHIILADKTIVYDIVEKMGDPAEAIAAYTTDIDVSWVARLPRGVQKGMLLSADRDVMSEDVLQLIDEHQGTAADWESGAIAWTARRNGVPVLIMRGISDMISEHEAEAFNNLAAFEEGTARVMNTLVDTLPEILEQWERNT